MQAFATSAQPFSPSDVGINLWGISTFPGINLGTTDNNLNKSLSVGPTSNFANTGSYQNRWDFTSSANWVTGRHTVYFGLNWNHTQLNIINLNTQAASIAFTNFAQFLLGNLNPSSSTFYNGSSNRYYRAEQIGAYIQDNYRLRSNLTLNLGLRWDDQGPLSEARGNLVDFRHLGLPVQCLDGHYYQYRSGLRRQFPIRHARYQQFHAEEQTVGLRTPRRYRLEPRLRQEPHRPQRLRALLRSR